MIGNTTAVSPPRLTAVVTSLLQNVSGAESRHQLLLISLIFLTAPLWVTAAELGEFEVEIIPPGEGVQYIVRNPNEALLVVESDIVRLSFEANMGIICVDHSDDEPGKYILHLHPGTSIITFKSPDHMSAKRRFYIDKKSYKSVRIRETRAGDRRGRGSLTIESKPSGASVEFNGILIGERTPVTLFDQPAGYHNLRLIVDGHAPLDTSTTIVKEVNKSIFLNLVKDIAGMSVTSEPTGATVFLDGNRLGKTPLERQNLAPGESSLTVQLEGYITNSQPINLKASETRQINVYLVRQTGSVSVTASPTGTEVFLDGKSVGIYRNKPLELEKVTLGRHTISGKFEGYQPAEETISVEFNQTTTIKLTLYGKSGALFVTSTPTGAAVLLDGKATRQVTPVKLPDVLAGEHEVTLRSDGYQDEVAKVEVLPLKTVSVNLTLDSKPKDTQQSFDSGLERFKGPLEGMEFVKIPSGSFMMGLNDGEQKREFVESFYIMTTEVTDKMVNNIYNEFEVRDDLPAIRYYHDSVITFIGRLTRYSKHVYRLPTEIEWEYACRAGSMSNFHSGLSESDLARAGWYIENSGGRSHPVGIKISNNFGLFDMHGNAGELCITADGGYVIRGGSYEDSADDCQSGSRVILNKNVHTQKFGFRLVVDVK